MKFRPYDFKHIEPKIQSYWREKGGFKADSKGNKRKKFIVGMFPYPSGSGLHVGHMLCYYTCCAQAHYARMMGYEVLNPIGFDAFGLPAEQHAIDTGEHPGATVKRNVASYTRLLKAAGISFDWDRSFSTTDADYYRWTQWIFLLFYNSWYDKASNRAAPISLLRQKFEAGGNCGLNAACDEDTPIFTAAEWGAKDANEQAKLLLHYRLAYRRKTNVNWCPKLGTVLANDEVKDGHSERGGHPVVQKEMMQWHLRMTAYADRLLQGLEGLEWPEAIKTTQRQWIGRSEGATIDFEAEAGFSGTVKVFTTRIETLYGVSYLALAPEHRLVGEMMALQGARVSGLTTAEKEAFDALKVYVERARNMSERARQQGVNEVSGCFTGFYARHPITQQRIPIWVADYVLGGYGSGAVMGVPAHDDRDHRFAKHFGLPIIQVISGDGVDVMRGAHVERGGGLMNSGDLDGLSIPDGRTAILKKLIALKRGGSTISMRLRDPIFSRQRYWGEPMPIYYRDGVPHPLSEEDLPLRLPDIDAYKPNAAGDPPLSRAQNWHTSAGEPLELTTMPAWAGSNWYFLRYMDPHNRDALVGRDAVNYWRAVDIYIGGKEHATGHLFYARFCTMLLFDRGIIPIEEPFQYLINQGIIQHKTAFAYRIKNTNRFVSHGKKGGYDTVPFRVPTGFVEKNVLDQAAFKAWRPHLAGATFILESGQYICGDALEKMSKSKHNIIDPQQMIDEYGADALRLHLFFLGPIRQSKPWSAEGIEGVVRFLKKVGRLFYSQKKSASAHEVPSLGAVEKIIHRTTKQVTEGLERYTLNTSISGLMICVNELLAVPWCPETALKDFLRLLAPFAPHMAEALWQEMGAKESIFCEDFPTYDPVYLEEETITYPVAINGKKRAELTASADGDLATIKAQAVALPALQRWLTGKTIANVILVPKRMINIVLG